MKVKVLELRFGPNVWIVHDMLCSHHLYRLEHNGELCGYADSKKAIFEILEKVNFSVVNNDKIGFLKYITLKGGMPCEQNLY